MSPEQNAHFSAFEAVSVKYPDELSEGNPTGFMTADPTYQPDVEMDPDEREWQEVQLEEFTHRNWQDRFPHGPRDVIGRTYQEVYNDPNEEVQKFVKLTRRVEYPKGKFRMRFKAFLDKINAEPYRQCDGGLCEYVKFTSNATHDTYRCTQCQYQYSERRNQDWPHDEQSCPHTSIDYRGSTSTTVTYFCKGCGTPRLKISRAKHKQLQNSLTKLQLKETRVHRLVENLAEDRFMDHGLVRLSLTNFQQRVNDMLSASSADDSQHTRDKNPTAHDVR